MPGERPRSLVWATNIDVLPLDHVVARRDGYLVVHSPGNPAHYWGNLLVFDDPPRSGDGQRWEASFEREFGANPGVRHRTFAWDRTDAALGSAEEEFVARGYEIGDSIGLVGTPDGLRPHARENRAVEVRRLDPVDGADAELWAQAIELQVAARDGRFTEAAYRAFCTARMHDLRALFRVGRGGWYVAIEPDRGTVAGSCGIVVTGPRARYQTVDTAEVHRRQGICSRLVVEAARHSATQHRIEHFVIAADPAYHALHLYESLGFKRWERVVGVCRRPPGD